METVQLTGRKQRLALVESKSCGGAYKQDRFRKLKLRENTKGLSRERVNNRHKTKVKKKKKKKHKKKKRKQKKKKKEKKKKKKNTKKKRGSKKKKKKSSQRC